MTIPLLKQLVHDPNALDEALRAKAWSEQDLLAAIASAAVQNVLSAFEVFVACGVDVSQSESLALRTAAECNNLDVVKFCLPLSDPKAQDSQALFFAAFYDNEQIFELLLPHSDPRASLVHVNTDHTWPLVNRLRAIVAAEDQKKTLEDHLPVCASIRSKKM